MKIAKFSLVLAPALLAAAAITSHPVLAAPTVHVPFPFIASGHSCPAGDYLVHSGNQGSSIGLQGPAGQVFFLIGPGEPNPRDKRVILTFDKEGKRYLLRTVQYRGNVTNRLDKHFPENIVATEKVVGAQ